MNPVKWKFDGKVCFAFKKTHQEKGTIVYLPKPFAPGDFAEKTPFEAC